MRNVIPFIIVAGLIASGLVGWAYAYWHDRKEREKDALYDEAGNDR